MYVQKVRVQTAGSRSTINYLVSALRANYKAQKHTIQIYHLCVELLFNIRGRPANCGKQEERGFREK